MQKPNNYENVKIGEYTPINVGGHHLSIKKVEEAVSKSGKNMLRVYFDTAKNDSQPNFYANEFKNDIRPEKKWPHGGTQYIVVEDKDGNCSKSFKGFISCFEKSNNREATWGDKFVDQFKNAKIGGVFGKVENEYNGKVTMRTELRWFCEDSKADDAKVPEPKYLDNKTSSETASSTSNDDFMTIPDGVEENLPFD